MTAAQESKTPPSSLTAVPEGWRLGAGVRQPVHRTGEPALGVEAVAAGRWSLRAGRPGAGRVRKPGDGRGLPARPRENSPTGPKQKQASQQLLCWNEQAFVPGSSGPRYHSDDLTDLAHALTTHHSPVIFSLQAASHGSCLALQGLPNGACADRPSDSGWPGCQDQVKRPKKHQLGWMIYSRRTVV